MKAVILSYSKIQTRLLGKELSFSFKPGDVVLLRGDLGAGKTTFVSGVAMGLCPGEEVVSPTFNIMKCYPKGRIPLYHIDAYRLEGQNIEIGLDEYIEGDGVCLIEWPVFIEKLIPDEHLDITFEHLGGDDRRITVESDCPRFFPLIERLNEAEK